MFIFVLLVQINDSTNQQMDNLLKQLPQLAKDKYNENKKYFAKLKKKPPKNLDYIMQQLHDEEFENTDCLTCANCCKTTGPLFTNVDIERISKHLKLKPHQFVTQYLRIDEDNDHVLQDRKSTRLNSSHVKISYAVFC